MTNKFMVFILILSFSFLSCDEQIINNNVAIKISEPLISIDTPKSGKIVDEIVYIKVKVKEIENIDRVEFIIDDSLFFYDTLRPYDYRWNTTKYNDNTTHLIKAILYIDNHDTIESESISLIIDNSSAIPNSVNIISVTYDTTEVINNLVEMFITWNPSIEMDFKSYTLFHAETEHGIKDSIFCSFNKLDTIFSTENYKPNIDHWFWVLISDTSGLTNLGNGLASITKTTPPDTSILDSIIYNNGFQISWSKCNNQDFNLYRLYQSNFKDMNNKTILAEFEDSLQTSYLVEQKELKYYQIETENIWGLTSRSNIQASDYTILIENEIFSVLNTVNLSQNNITTLSLIPNNLSELINLEWVDLSSFQLSGIIPSGIGNLSKLKYLNLSYNQLTGEIPSDISNLSNLEYLNLSHNQLSGELLSNIDNLINLEYLNLSYNLLSSNLPSVLWNTSKLKRLLLNNNQFNGNIEPEIENLTNITIIELQENQFSGFIPDQICFFYNNEISVNLRYNFLCPPYPECSLINEYFIFGQDTSSCY